MNFPSNLKYTDHDEWILIDGDTVTIGISDFAQDALGELVHVELPEVGESFEAASVVCEVESVKAVAEIYTPVAGEVIAVNEDLEDEAEKINEDAYGAWIFKLKVADTSFADALMDADAYKAKVEA